MEEPSDPIDMLTFIDEVKKIKSEYDTVAKYTGVNFNIFNILDVSSKEVKLHSNFLAEMLNPNGSHMQGDTFLKIFLKDIEDKIKWTVGGIGGFESEAAEVHKEFWTGKINEDYTEGGSIDILIKNNHQGIIIENKIYANDQHNQLLRYYNFGKKAFNSDTNFRVLYLTLDCSEPSEDSTNGITHFSCISYETHIKNWLEKCLTEVYDFPLVFALIRQYLNHVKHLTNQSIFKIMNEELEKKIKNTYDAFKAAREISNTLLTIRETLFEKITKNFYSYFSRNNELEYLPNFNINISLDTSKTHGYRVCFVANAARSEGENYNSLKEIVLKAGGWNEDHQYLKSWLYLIKIPRNLDCYTDETMYPLLNQENFNKLFKEIDAEIKGFSDLVINALTPNNISI